MKKSSRLAAGLLLLGVAGIAAADQLEDAIAFRKAAFTLIKANFGPMGAMAKGEMPFDKDAFARRAANLEILSSMPWEHFIDGSGVGSTKAKPEVWSKEADYRAAADKFQAEAAKLAQIVKSGDERAIKTQFGATAKSCKSCHESFKNK